MSFEFIKVNISDSILQESQKMANKLGCLGNSIRKGEGNIAGYLGQLVILTTIEDMEWKDTYDYDLIWKKKLKVEVKTKDRTVIPKSHYECSVAYVNHTQKADIYAFVSLLRDNNKYISAFILGYLSCEEYIKKSKFLPLGSIDNSNGWVVKQSCYNLPISELVEFKHNI